MADLGYIIVIILLISSNLVTVYFYQRQVQLLIDKTMSKSYSEYVQTKNLEQGSHQLPVASTQDVMDDSVLNELNAILK